MTTNSQTPFLVFDCDPGCDDALAISLVLRANNYKQIEILTVAGNVGVDSATTNALRLVTIALSNNSKTSVKVFKGCGRSLTGWELPASNVHGRDGLGDIPESFLKKKGPNVRKSQKMHAVQRILQIVNEREPFDLLCTGPLTNLATALTLMDSLQQDRFWKLAKRVVWMGGQFQTAGNITPASEFNIFHDPVAAQIVLDSWRVASARPNDTQKERFPKIRLVPIDATEQIVLSLECKTSPPASSDLGSFLRSALITYGRFHAIACLNPKENYHDRDEKVFKSHLLGSSGIKEWKPFCYVHDALAAWVMINGFDKPGYRWKQMKIRIDTSRGETRGHVFDMGQKAQPFSVNAPEIGTSVYWLEAITLNKSEKLLKELNTILL